MFTNLLRRGVLAVGLAALISGGALAVTADSTAGGNNCKGVATWENGVPKWVGCWPNTCSSPPSVCWPRTFQSSGTFEKKICTCGEDNNLVFDSTVVGGTTVPWCSPMEYWDDGHLFGLGCAALWCASGTCAFCDFHEEGGVTTAKCCCQ